MAQEQHVCVRCGRLRREVHMYLGMGGGYAGWRCGAKSVCAHVRKRLPKEKRPKYRKELNSYAADFDYD